LVGDTDLLCDIRRADVGDNQLLQQESQRLTRHRICPKIPISAQQFGLLPYLLGKAGAPSLGRQDFSSTGSVAPMRGVIVVPILPRTYVLG
jgi:hypothetical protein